jgi:hypothetical protein
MIRYSSGMRLLGWAGLVGATLALGCSSGSGSAPGGSGSSSICYQLASLPCSQYSSADECNQDVADSRASAQAAGCGSQYQAALNCYAEHPPSCNANGGMKVDSACTQAIATYIKCDPSSVCTYGGSNSSCDASCGDTSMSCDLGETSATCTCTSGAHQNLQFSLGSTNPCQRTTLLANCQ